MKETYNPSQPSNFIIYLDVNNLYGRAMSQLLPTHGFEWMTEDELEDWRDMLNGKGCILEVDLEYAIKLHDLHNDYPLAPENIIPPGTKVSKLVPNLDDKNKYVVHYVALKQYESLGLKVTKVHRGISFYESLWLKPYIDKNTKLRTKAKTCSKNISSSL